MIESLRNVKHLTVGLAVLSMSIAATGCGSASGTSMSNLLNNVQVTSFTQNGDLWAQLTAQLNTGGFILAGLNVPIVDPKNPSVEYGQITLQSALCSGSNCTGQGTLSISVDITQVAHVPALTNSTLPNGTPIPVSGLNNAAMLALPVGNTGATVYIALGKGVAVLGAALPFKALDSVGKYVPGVDIFDVFNVGNVTGLVGMFFGSTTNTSGLGLFADLSNVINTGSTTTVAAMETRQMIRAIQSVPNRTIMTPVTASPSDTDEVYYRLYRLSRKHTHLQVQ